MGGAVGRGLPGSLPRKRIFDDAVLERGGPPVEAELALTRWLHVQHSCEVSAGLVVVEELFGRHHSLLHIQGAKGDATKEPED